MTDLHKLLWQEQRERAEAAEADAKRYAMLFRDTWRNGKGIGVFAYIKYPGAFMRLSIKEANEYLDALSEEKGSFNSTYDENARRRGQYD